MKLLLSSCLSVFVLISNATAAEPPNPIGASLVQEPQVQIPGLWYRVRYSPRTGIFLLTPASGAPPVGPAGIDQVLTKAWQTAHNAGFNALAVVGASGTATATSPVGADEVANAVWNSANNALAVYCILGCGAAVSGPAANGVLFTNPTGALFSTATGGAGTLCLVETNGGNPTFGSCSGSAAWSSLVNPNSNLALTLGNNTTTLTVGTATTNPWILQDTTGNTGTNPLFQVNTVGTSTAAVAAFYAKGTSNGVSISNAGVLAPAGTGVINANQVNGATVPASAALVTTNSSSQLSALSTSGNTGNMLSNNGTGAAWSGPALLVDQFAGANMGAKINACLAALPASGGTCDARAFTGSQSATATIGGSTNGWTLLLGAVTLTSSANPAFQLAYYSSSAPVGCTTLTNCGGSEIIGLGPNTTLIKTSTTGATAVQAFAAGSSVNSINNQVIGVMLSSNTGTGGADPNSVGIDFTGTDNSQILNSWVQNYGLGLKGTMTGSVDSLYNSVGYTTFQCLGAGTGYTAVWLYNGANAYNFFGDNWQHCLVDLALGSYAYTTGSGIELVTQGNFEAVDTLAAPAQATNSQTSGTGFAGTYYTKVSYASIAGESALSTESTQITVTAGNVLVINSPAAANGAIGWRPYATLVNGASGTETTVIGNGTCTLASIPFGGGATDSTLCAIGSNWTQTAATSQGDPQPAYNSSGAAVVALKAGSITVIDSDFEEQGTNGAFLVAGNTHRATESASLYNIALKNNSTNIVAATPCGGSGICDFTDGGVSIESPGLQPVAYSAGVNTSAGPNLVPNGAFEGWTSTTNAPGWCGVNGTNWNAGSQTNQIATTTGNFTVLPVDLGSYSMSSPTGGYIGFGTCNPIFIDPIRPYTLTFQFAAPATSTLLVPLIQLENCTRSSVPPSCSPVTTAGGTIVASQITPGSSAVAQNMTYLSVCQCYRNTNGLVPAATNSFQRETLLLGFTSIAGSSAPFNAIKIAFVSFQTSTIYVDDVYFGQGAALLYPSGGSLADTGNGIVNGYATVNGGLSIAQHLVQPTANADLGHKFTLASGTASYTFSTAFGSTPVCVVSDETTAGGARLSALSTTAYTITGGSTDVVDVVCVGNPN